HVVPPSVRTIAVPPFGNQTLTFKIEQDLTAAVMRELIARSPFRVQANVEGSDATLRGAVVSLYSSPVLFDSSSGCTWEVLPTVSLRFQLVDNKDGRTIFEANDWPYREPYQISQDPATYFGENQPALERLSREVAASLVSALMEGFE